MRTIATALISALVFLAGCESRQAGHGHDDLVEEKRGPNGGRLLEHGDFGLELSVYETGVPPEFRVWLYENGRPLPPDAARVEVRLTRLGGEVDRFEFRPERDFLRGDGTVTEPHSFDVAVTAVGDGEAMQWEFASYEGRTTIAADTARSMGVATATAGPATLRETVVLSGVVQADPARVSRVRARYPGIVREVAVQPWSQVARGTLLARVQSNDTLQNYALTAPIGGVIVEHRAQVGESTAQDVLFAIVDLSKVWVEFDVFQRELGRIEAGQDVEVLDLDGGQIASGRIERIAPLAVHGSQSVRARVVLENASGDLRPGQFVSGRVLVAEAPVALAVERSALQRFRDFDVVFERIGDTYEVRMLALGRGDARQVEVLEGLRPGAEYVTANSYLIKADIEKSGAAHDH